MTDRGLLAQCAAQRQQRLAVELGCSLQLPLSLALFQVGLQLKTARASLQLQAQFGRLL